MRIATFNVQNLRLRRREGEVYLDGARDGDAPDEDVHNEAHARSLDAQDRELTADLIAQAQADVVALQEVFDQQTLDHFHDVLLEKRGAFYPHRVCLEGNDGRSVDVAVLSRLPLESVRSNADLRFADIGFEPPAGLQAKDRVFRRDCLALRCAGVHLFVCHLKNAAAGDLRSHAIRRAEAFAIRHVVKTRAQWLALGDFNAHDPDDVRDLEPLMAEFAVDLCARLPEEERWTYYDRQSGAYTCPDRIMASPALARRFADARPQVMRTGMARCASRYTGERHASVGRERPHASDHALLFVDIEL